MSRDNRPDDGVESTETCRCGMSITRGGIRDLVCGIPVSCPRCGREAKIAALQVAFRLPTVREGRAKG